MRAFINMQTNFADYSTGVLKKLPWPFTVSVSGIEKAEAAVAEIVDISQALCASFETSPQFTGIPKILNQKVLQSLDVKAAIQRAISKCDEYVCGSLGLEDIHWAREVLNEAVDDEDANQVHAEDDEDEDGIGNDGTNWATDILSYCVGVAFGRWDVRNVTSATHTQVSTAPFAPYPCCPPGTLQDNRGLPCIKQPVDYPVEIASGGILSDDGGNGSDIMQSVGRVIEIIWADAATLQEQALRQMVSVSNLRDYFRKPGKGGVVRSCFSLYKEPPQSADILAAPILKEKLCPLALLPPAR